MHKPIQSHRGAKAFTLIELLIVVAIIAILAAIAVPNFLEAQVRAKVSRAKSDMRSLATAIEAYRVDNEHYPPIAAPNGTIAGGAGPGALQGPSVLDPTIGPGVSSRFIWITTPIAYISTVFTDPFINQSVKFALNCNASGTVLPEYDTFDYVDVDSFLPGGLLCGSTDPNQCRANSTTSGAAWRVNSSGPDLMNCFGGGSSASDVFTRSNGHDYDPTNGSTSSGDIVRIGGVGPYSTLREPTIDRVKNIFLHVP